MGSRGTLISEQWYSITDTPPPSPTRSLKRSKATKIYPIWKFLLSAAPLPTVDQAHQRQRPAVWAGTPRIDRWVLFWTGPRPNSHQPKPPGGCLGAGDSGGVEVYRGFIQVTMFFYVCVKRLPKNNPEAQSSGSQPVLVVGLRVGWRHSLAAHMACRQRSRGQSHR